MLDDAADVIGQSAVREGNVRSPLHHHDLGVLVEPAETGGARSSAGDTTHDYDLHGVLLRMTPLCRRRDRAVQAGSQRCRCAAIPQACLSPWRVPLQIALR